MTNTSKTILFFGTEDFSTASLDKLISDGFKIGAVITKPDSQKGRGRKTVPPAVKLVAEQHNIPVWQPQRMSDVAADIASFDKPVGVLVSFGKIIPQSIIDLFEPGIINLHPSLLPLYRGPSPIESAIINGDSKTGLSIMKLSAAMDAGPVYIQESVPLSGSETRPELYSKLANQGADLLSVNLQAIIDGRLLPEPQNETLASYCQLLRKNNGLIEPQVMSAQTIERMVRAYLGYPKTRLRFLDADVIVTKARIVEVADETTIDCLNDSLLAIDELIAPSGKIMTAQAYLRGKHL